MAKVLGNVEYKEVMLFERYFTRIIRYHTFVIRRRVNRKYEYILLCKVNETVTDTWHFEPIVGGFRWKDSVGDVHMDGYPAIVGMLFAKYCKVL